MNDDVTTTTINEATHTHTKNGMHPRKCAERNGWEGSEKESMRMIENYDRFLYENMDLVSTRER